MSLACLDQGSNLMISKTGGGCSTDSSRPSRCGIRLFVIRDTTNCNKECKAVRSSFNVIFNLSLSLTSMKDVQTYVVYITELPNFQWARVG